MPRLDDLVRDAIDDLVESAPVNAVFAEVAARRARRRRVRRTAGAVVSVAAVAVAASLATLWRDTTTRVTFAGQPVETTPPETQPLPPEPKGGGFALWPEDTPAEWQAADGQAGVAPRLGRDGPPVRRRGARLARRPA